MERRGPEGEHAKAGTVLSHTPSVTCHVQHSRIPGLAPPCCLATVVQRPSSGNMRRAVGVWAARFASTRKHSCRARGWMGLGDRRRGEGEAGSLRPLT